MPSSDALKEESKARSWAAKAESGAWGCSAGDPEQQLGELGLCAVGRRGRGWSW